MDVVHVQQRSSLLNWAYFCQGKSMDELKQSLLLTTMELENTKMKAQEEIKTKDEQIIKLNNLLTRVIKEKDEAEEKCQRLMLEKLFLQHQSGTGGPPISGISSIEDDPRRGGGGGGGGGGGIDSNNGFSNSDCEESIVSSPVLDTIPAPAPAMAEEQAMLSILPDRPLPEKGKLLQAVMKAGPLLQTLLLAGPLPQWRHPPPPLDTYQIPPPPVVVPSPPNTPTPANSIQQDPLLPIAAAACYNNNVNSCGRINKKRGLYDSPYSPTETKYQRLLLQ